MEKVLPAPSGIRLSGGLSRVTGFARLLADVTALPVHTDPEPEATARGIAHLAQRGIRPGRPGREPGELEPVRLDPVTDRALSDRYHRFREILREETGV
jgi:sugar (pentulose or hexulose) kinase